MRAGLVVAADRRVKDMYAVAIDIPIGKSGFFAAAIGAALKNLRGQRKRGDVTLRRDFEKRAAIERHVVIHQVHPVLTNTRQASRNRGAESERLRAVNELYRWKRGADTGVGRLRRAARDDDDLVWFV